MSPCFARVADGDDGLVIAQVAEETAENGRGRREDAPEAEVVLQMGEGHPLALPVPCPRRKRIDGEAAPPDSPRRCPTLKAHPSDASPLSCGCSASVS